MPFVLFDCDGVIVDSFQYTIKIAQQICPALTHEGFRTWFEGNINRGYEENMPGHGPDCRHDLDFFQLYLPFFQTEVRIFEGMETAIRKLFLKHQLVIISSMATDPIKEFLRKAGLLPQFISVLGNDIHESKVHKINLARRKHGIGPDDCVFVTDTSGDVVEAKEAGVDSIAVSWGYHDLPRLMSVDTFRIVDDPSQLPDAVDEYFAQNPD